MSLIVEKKGRVLQITLNRPDRGNSLNPETVVELRKTFIDAQSMENINCILLSGSGEKDFCTGIDVKEAGNLSFENRINIANVAGDVATLIYYGKPTVVVANGRSMGMGIVFSCAADYAIVAENSVCQMPEINVGIFPGASCVAIMTRKIGIRNTEEILMLGEPFTSQKAIFYGVFNESLPMEEIHKKGKEIAKNLSRKNPILLKSLKNNINSALDLPYDKVIEYETIASGWAKWKDGNDEIEEINKRFSLSMKLTGNPEKLID